jgi:putative FmdB family regulatory protein
MPIYEYRCRQCGEVFGHRFRTLEAAEAGAVPLCPACGAGEVQRLISSVSTLNGEAGSASSGGDGAGTTGSKQVFGRKELNKVLKDRGS